jgi:hypothetical protein
MVRRAAKNFFGETFELSDHQQLTSITKHSINFNGIRFDDHHRLCVLISFCCWALIVWNWYTSVYIIRGVYLLMNWLESSTSYADFQSVSFSFYSTYWRTKRNLPEFAFNCRLITNYVSKSSSNSIHSLQWIAQHPVGCIEISEIKPIGSITSSCVHTIVMTIRVYFEWLIIKVQKIFSTRTRERRIFW